ncbi:MAG: AMP-binding protein, partial [Actinophytocola sp.]|nr:AMP-binding protein [Actinophytocola sp.]
IGPDAFGSPLVNLVMSPVGHSTGFFWGALMSAHLGGTAVYLERWQPELALRVLDEQRITTMIGSPTFLLDVLRTEGASADRVPDLRLVAMAGAPVPRPLVAKARRQLDCAVVPAWGMTEYGIGVSGSPELARERIETTDGRPVPGCQVRVCHADSPADPGEEGDLQIRGPGLFAGYYGRPDFTADALTPDGWFRTGDRAVIEADGHVSLMGRTKDIVIRGGENIPVIEIENLLYTHPAVAEVAVIGVPDERLGERVCAVIAAKPGLAPPDLPTVSEFLLTEGLSKRYLPERLVVLDELPKTMSGKIRKVELRQRYREGVVS